MRTSKKSRPVYKNVVFLTAQQAKDIDVFARERYGISTLVLMENAGRALAIETAKRAVPPDKIAVICGKGNNGGDGFVAARHLMELGENPDVFLAAGIEDVRGEARVNLDILRNMGAGVFVIDKKNIKLFRKKIRGYDVIVDAVLGVGVKGEVRGLFEDVIETINSQKACIISVDIPSGLDATSGSVLGVCVKADKTVTFMAKKYGMIRNDGPRYCGRIIVRDIGVPEQCWIRDVEINVKKGGR